MSSVLVHQKKHQKQTGLGVLFLFLLLAGAIVLRVSVEGTNYISPDSEFYMKVAQNIVEGNGIVAPTEYPFTNEDTQSYLGVWPAGYPVIIAAFSFITSDYLWASKIANLFFLGGIALLFLMRFNDAAPWAMLAFFSNGLLEVFSYTWSEGPFLFFTFLLVFNLEKLQLRRHYFLVAISLICLFLLRYAGLVFWIFTGLYSLYLANQGKKETALRLTLVLGIFSLIPLAYLYANYLQTGFLTGAERSYPELESGGTFMFYLIRGIINEMTYFRDIWFVWPNDILAIGLLLFQVLVIGWLWKVGMFTWKISASLPLMLAGFYILMIIALRLVSPFDSFNYRIFAPATGLLYMLLFLNLYKNWNKHPWVKKAVFGVAFFSLLMNLPKAYLLSLI
ncbi:hypothetical protein [Litoribacter populi]|uniref:hypothetical protein n=1 Tax=Litoribacter populi TaxID=2598460 RepID=UPI00117FFAFA|nr:hypothetical protein [Litoribacter populi]